VSNIEAEAGIAFEVAKGIAFVVEVEVGRMGSHMASKETSLASFAGSYFEHHTDSMMMQRVAVA
jgi:hypothetical protein